MTEKQQFDYETPVLDVFQYHGVTIVYADEQSRTPTNIDTEDDDNEDIFD